MRVNHSSVPQFRRILGPELQNSVTPRALDTYTLYVSTKERAQPAISGGKGPLKKGRQAIFADSFTTYTLPDFVYRMGQNSTGGDAGLDDVDIKLNGRCCSI